MPISSGIIGIELIIRPTTAQIEVVLIISFHNFPIIIFVKHHLSHVYFRIAHL